MAASLLLAACDPQPASEPSGSSDGERIYRTPVEDGNSYACASCHALTEPAADGLRRPGHPLGDATARPTYKNGALGGFRDAMNSCLVEWMNAEPWEEDDARYLALYEFLDGQHDGSEAAPIEYEIVEPPSDLTGGDPAAGQALFNASCAVCHGQDGVGSEQAIPVDRGALEPGYIARRVRTSGAPNSDVYAGLTGGLMPFWAADRLSDTELRDLVAWLSRNYEEPTAGDPPDEPPSPEDPPEDPPTGTNCAVTHERVGQSAELQTFFHGVQGTARIVDDCTIVIQNFHYDGAGIEVRLYGGLGGDYHGGFAIGDDLVKSGGYNGDTLEFILPADRTLDELDGVSVWCVAVGVDFGSGMFQ